MLAGGCEHGRQAFQLRLQLANHVRLAGGELFLLQQRTCHFVERGLEVHDADLEVFDALFQWWRHGDVVQSRVRTAAAPCIALARASSMD